MKARIELGIYKLANNIATHLAEFRFQTQEEQDKVRKFLTAALALSLVTNRFGEYIYGESVLVNTHAFTGDIFISICGANYQVNLVMDKGFRVHTLGKNNFPPYKISIRWDADLRALYNACTSSLLKQRR